MLNRIIQRVTSGLFGLFGLWLAQPALAHGLMEDPPARNWFCGAVTKPDQVSNGTALYPECGGAFASNPNSGYNFMSVLTHARGRAAVTPLPANVCGFNSENWQGGATPWDQAINWPTSKIAAGRKKITWNISWGPHFDDTEEFRYWITKPGFVFSPTKALSWNDFEDAAFCTLTYDDKNPTANPDVVPDKATAHFATYCTVPQRSGRHVIYGEWGRNQYTLERFHGCMDVVFEGSAPAIEARISAQPNVTEFTGAGSITLDASGSVGSGLSYQWSVNAPNASLYTLSAPTAAQTQLNLAAPSATSTVQVALQVSNASGSSSATKTITHKPAVASTWTDLGALTPAARTLKEGDKVSVRAVLSTGVDQYYPSTPLTLTAATAGPTAWPYALGQAVNAANGSVRVGVLSGGTVTPTQDATANRLYALNTAGVANAFLQVQSTEPVTASYTVNNSWNAGYCATIKITNNSTTTITWTASLPVEGTVTQLWNASWSQTGSTVTMTGPTWASTLAPGATYTQAGFCATR